MGKYQILPQTSIQKIKASHAVSYFFRLNLVYPSSISARCVGQSVLFSSAAGLCLGLISIVEPMLNGKYKPDLKWSVLLPSYVGSETADVTGEEF